MHLGSKAELSVSVLSSLQISFLGTGRQLEKVEGCYIVTGNPCLCYRHPVSRRLDRSCEL